MMSIGFEPWTTVSVSTVLSCLTNLCPTAIAVSLLCETRLIGLVKDLSVMPHFSILSLFLHLLVLHTYLQMDAV